MECFTVSKSDYQLFRRICFVLCNEISQINQENHDSDGPEKNIWLSWIGQM